MRRIVQYPTTTHYSEIKISPQWHQWLRHTRSDAPSITEQSQDLVRQQNLKVLAAQADARWAAQPSFLDAPGRERGQPVAALETKNPRFHAEPSVPGEKNKQATEPTTEKLTGAEEYKRAKLFPDGMPAPSGLRPGEEDGRGPITEKKTKEDPWKQARGGPSEEWQPKAWTGNIAAARRR